MARRYEIRQVIETDNYGNTHIISTSINEIGQQSLYQKAISLINQYEYEAFTNEYKPRISSRYIGYKKIGDKHYSLIITQKQDGIYLSIPSKLINEYIEDNNIYSTIDNDFIFTKDKQFPYAVKTFVGDEVSFKTILHNLLYLITD